MSALDRLAQHEAFMRSHYRSVARDLVLIGLIGEMNWSARRLT